MPTDDGRCTHVKPDGTRCRAKTVRGADRCCFHDPAAAARTAEGRRRGGEKRAGALKPATLSADSPDLPLATVPDVVALLADTINRVRSGRLGVPVGNCIGQLAGTLLKAIEHGDMERRMADVERELAGRRAGP